MKIYPFPMGFGLYRYRGRFGLGTGKKLQMMPQGPSGSISLSYVVENSKINVIILS